MINQMFSYKTIKKDILHLISIFGIVIFFWVICRGFDLNHIIGQGDATSGFVWLLNEYSKHNINGLTYNPSLLGGYPMTGALGLIWPLYIFIKLTGLPAYIVLNLFVLLLQTVIGFFSCKLISLIFNLVSKIEKTVTYFLIISATSFSPLLGWRISFGHMNLVLGVTTLIAMIYLLHAFSLHKETFIDLIVAFFVVSCTICFPTFQILLHTIIILPIYFFISDLWTVDSPYLFKKLIKFLLIVFLCNLPFMADMYLYYLSGDTVRSENINIYGYAMYDLSSFLSSLFLYNNILNISDNEFLWHELNYPISLGYASLLLIKSTRKAAVVCAFAICTVSFVFNVPFLSELFKALPILGQMRVPQRILLPVGFMMNIGSCIWLLNKFRYNSPSLKLLGLNISLGLFVLFLSQNNLTIVNVITLMVLFLIFFDVKIKSWISDQLIVFISFAYIGSFFALMPNLMKFDKVSSSLKVMSAGVSRYNPYIRSYVDAELPEFHINSPMALGISSLNGYFYPTGRFSKFIQGLYQVPYDPLRLDWRFLSSSRYSKILSSLFNVKNRVTAKDGLLISGTIDAGHDGIIYPEKIIFEDGLKESLEILKEDWKVGVVEKKYFLLLRDVGPCRQGSLNVQYNSKIEGLTLKGSLRKECLIILPTNYNQVLGWYPKNNLGVEIFPADYALLGLKLPKGEIDGQIIPRPFYERILSL